MGKDPKTSALNGFCQAHEVKNLFVTDGACFVTNPDKNPTLSILALFLASVGIPAGRGEEREYLKDIPVVSCQSSVKDKGPARLWLLLGLITDD